MIILSHGSVMLDWVGIPKCQVWSHHRQNFCFFQLFFWNSMLCAITTSAWRPKNRFLQSEVSPNNIIITQLLGYGNLALHSRRAGQICELCGFSVYTYTFFVTFPQCGKVGHRLLNVLSETETETGPWYVLNYII